MITCPYTEVKSSVFIFMTLMGLPPLFLFFGIKLTPINIVSMPLKNYILEWQMYTDKFLK